MKRRHVMRYFVTIFIFSFMSFCADGMRLMEKLDRGVVAVYQGGSQVYIGWRLFGTDPQTIRFNVYRDSVKINTTPVTDSTNYMDTNGSLSSTYSIAPVLDGVELEMSNPVSVWNNFYHDISLQVPAGVTTPDGVTCTYSPNDASVGDVDGDGQYEIILKWDPSNSRDNAQSGYTGDVYLDAYEIDGTFLWRIDLGINIRAGAHYTQFMVYDFDSDGRAEVACKTADGTVDGVGAVIGDPSADWRNSSGYILTGPEYLTVFDGQTGAALDTVDYVVPRGTVSSWGDSYGNRVDRFLACVAYLDGERPSVVMCRGYYTRAVLAAWDFRDGRLSQRWVFDSYDGTAGNSAYSGQGNHNLSVADVDGDGKDEIIYGSCTIDDDGTGLYSTGLGHGDALHVSDMDPDRPGLEVWQCHEGSQAGATYRDAATGEVLFDDYNSGDVGRACAAHIDSRYRGYQLWSTASSNVFNTDGTIISSHRPSVNFLVWWTGDLQRELLDSAGGSGTNPILDKWGGDGTYRLISLYSIPTSYSTASNNSTKANPCLSGDILGDWREEIILRSSDNTKLRIFTTTEVTNHRIYTLMHDPQYRLSIAWQNVAYNQPPHTSFYLGDGMADPPVPDIQLVSSSPGGLLREWWMGIEGKAVSDLTSNVNFPDNPSGWNYPGRFEGPVDWDNNYGTRLRGYLIPPQDGNYTFWVAADDSAELWLSSDALPDNAVKIASVSAWTDPFQWDKYAEQQSVSIPLLAGHKYYIELLHKEGTGGDHYAVAWQGPGLNQQVIEGAYLQPWKGELVGDLTGNNAVNINDFSEFATFWLNRDCGIDLTVDMNGDCSIDTQDLTLLVENWLIGAVTGGISTLQIQEGGPGFLGVFSGTIDTNHTGYTGTGFVNTDNAAGQYIEWTVDAPAAGNYDLQWRFSNGSSTNRTGTVSINGTTQATNIGFSGTGDGNWDVWDVSASVPVSLAEGANTIRLTAETSEGLANIDWIEITGVF